MEQNRDITKWVIVFIALAAGLGGGYYFGLNRGVAKEKAAEEARKLEAEKEAAEAVNPFAQVSTNPFEKPPVNPFENVKTNPFE